MIGAWGYCQLVVCWCNLQRPGSNRKCVGSWVGCQYNHQTYLFRCILYEIVSPRKHIKRRNCSCSWSPHCYFKVLSEILFYSRRRAGTIQVHEYMYFLLFSGESGERVCLKLVYVVQIILSNSADIFRQGATVDQETMIAGVWEQLFFG